jgi:hypothetical protein
MHVWILDTTIVGVVPTTMLQEAVFLGTCQEIACSPVFPSMSVSLSGLAGDCLYLNICGIYSFSVPVGVLQKRMVIRFM